MNKINDIYIKIKGGFGNQLFQYAKALEIQNNFGGDIYSLIEFHNPLNTKRPYLLNLKHFKLKKSLLSFVKFYFYLLPFKRVQIFKELKIYKYHQIIPNKKYILLDGYWQTFKSVHLVKVQLYNQIFNQIELNHNMKSYLKKIKCNNSVALHIRRGDYVNTFLLPHVCHYNCIITYP